MVTSQEVLKLLANHDQKLHKAVLADFRNISGLLNSDDIQELLDLGLEQEVLALVEEAVKKETKEFPLALTAIFISSGTFFASTLKIKPVFDVLEPRIAPTYGNYKRAVVNALATDIVETTSQVLFTTGLESITSKERADLVINSVGLSKKQWLAVQNYRNQLRNKSLEALRRGLRDKSMDPKLKELFRSGKGLTEAQIKVLVDRYIAAYKKLRADTIATTETTRAYSIAQNSLLQNLIDDGEIEESEIKRFWNTMRDEKVRKAHRPIPGMNKDGRDFNEPFQTPLGNLMYPGDPMGTPSNVYNCRCFLTFKGIEI